MKPAVALVATLSLTLSTLVMVVSPAAATTLMPTADTHAGTNQVLLNTNTGAPPYTGVDVNAFVGATRFYAEGYDGSSATVANIEAGQVWNGHETLGHVTTYLADPSAVGPQNSRIEYDRHATWVGAAIAGRNGGTTQGDWQVGIASGATLWSGAIATSWTGGAYSTSFNYTDDSFINPYKEAMLGSANTGGATADVINSSWNDVNKSAAGGGVANLGIDALANQTGKTVVFSAGNSGATSNSIGGPAVGLNVITVGMTVVAPVSGYEYVNPASSRGPSEFWIPASADGTVGTLVSSTTSKYAAVDIVAPGTDVTLATYGGTTGGNDTLLGGFASGSSSSYTPQLSGTSFAAPVVAGGATLMADAARAKLGNDTQALDGRVIKATMLNSADKLHFGSFSDNWTNGQNSYVSGSGLITTTQALDYAMGAGSLNLDKAYDQLFSGTTDVAGLGGGVVDVVGWDFGQVSENIPVEYHLNRALLAGSDLTVTLTWFVDRYINTTTNEVLEQSFDDLTLEVVKVTGTADEVIARSATNFNSVEHLFFKIGDTAQYMIRVLWSGEVWDLIGDTNSELFALAWSGTGTGDYLTFDQTVPAPAAWILLWLGLALLLWRRRHA